jgi:hypothetical protein
MSELAQQFDVHANQIKQWRDQLLEGLSGVWFWGQTRATRADGRCEDPSCQDWRVDPGLGSSAVGTVVERTTLFTMLLHLPRMESYQLRKSIKNGPAFARHGVEAVRGVIQQTMQCMPERLRQSLT